MRPQSERILIEDLDLPEGDMTLYGIQNRKLVAIKENEFLPHKISSETIITSTTTGTNTSEWVNYNGYTKSVTGAALSFNAGGLPAAGNLRFDIIQGLDNGTVTVKEGTVALIGSAVIPDADFEAVILDTILWNETGQGTVSPEIGDLDHLPSTGSVIKFDRPRTYNDHVSPNTNEVLTEDNASFRRVLTQIIFHQAASFTPPGTWKKSTRSDEYDPAKVNVIYVESFSDLYKRYKIERDLPTPFPSFDFNSNFGGIQYFPWEDFPILEFYIHPDVANGTTWSQFQLEVQWNEPTENSIAEPATGWFGVSGQVLGPELESELIYPVSPDPYFGYGALYWGDYETELIALPEKTKAWIRVRLVRISDGELGEWQSDEFDVTIF